MDFSLSEEQRAFQDAVRSFANQRMAPFAAAWDEHRTFPVESLREAAELGLAGIYCREELGGTGLTRLDAALIFEELATACPSTAAYISIHNMVAWMIDRFGDADQQARYMPRLMSMEWLSSYCLTEPGAGSDAASLRTKAVRDGDDYVITGQKVFISGATATDLYLVMARTGGEGASGVSAFLVPSDTPGLSFGKKEDKMGWNSQPTAAVMFEDCRLPAASLLGKEGDGFRFAMMGLDGGRVNIAACSLGGARACLDQALGYTKERKQFGRAVADFQNTQFALADMATELDASRLMVWRAAQSLDSDHPEKTVHCAMAKRLATDLCWQVVDRALQLHGGYGYIREYPVERYLRDLRVHRILEGTNEIMRLIVARRLLARA